MTSYAQIKKERTRLQKKLASLDEKEKRLQETCTHPRSTTEQGLRVPCLLITWKRCLKCNKSFEFIYEDQCE